VSPKCDTRSEPLPDYWKIGVGKIEEFLALPCLQFILVPEGL